MNDFANKNLLILSIGYPCGESESINFVKSQVDELKDYFQNIYIIAPTPYFPKFLSKSRFFNSKHSYHSQVKDYSYDNVHVYYPRFYTLPLKSFRYNINGDLAYKATLKTLDKNKIQFDIVHAHFTWHSGYIASKLAKRFCKKYILTVHESKDLLIETLHSASFKVHQGLQDADTIIRVNRQELQMLLDFNEKTIYIPNGVDKRFSNKYSKTECRKKLHLHSDKKIILNVANLRIKQKNQMNLIRSLGLLRKERSDYLCYLIGSPAGGDEKTIRNFIVENNLQDYIFLLGERSHEEVAIWMKAADLFYFPSYFESFGVVNIEALTSGTPVVSTINGGSEEIIISDEYGFLCDNPEDVVQLSQLVDKALNKEWNKSQLIQYGKGFEMSNVVEKIMQTYKDVYASD